MPYFLSLGRAALMACVVGLVVFQTSACSSKKTVQTGSWVVERETKGDTTIVRTMGGSVWKEPVHLVEELSIGVLEGEAELMFGSVQEIAVDADGGIYLFDGQAPALRYFDANGQYVRTLGGEGQGPGEYQDAALGLAVRSDGRLVMRDPRNARLNLYDPDGTPSDHWPFASGLYTSNAMTLGADDHVYLKIMLGRPERNKPWSISLLHLDAQGAVVDTIPEPQITGDPEKAGWTFAPRKLWTWSPLGYMVVGVSDQYAFEARLPEGKVLRIERAYEPVAVTPEERAEHEAVNDWRRKYQSRNLTSEIPPVPRTKPAYRDIAVGEQGRIWIHLHRPAEKVEGLTATAGDESRPPSTTWREPNVYDVYEPDGTYLGEVHVPPRTTLMVIRGDTVWGVRRGDLDEPYVVRLTMDRDRAG